jgi:S1-C subfamily serine protease
MRTLALVLCLLLVATSAGAVPELPELAAKAKLSVVHLTVYDRGGRAVGSGSGFFVADGRVVTNHHVVDDASRVVAKTADGRELEALGWLAADADKDIAILKMSGDALPEPLPLGSSTAVRPGDEVVVIGSPQGLSGTLSTGIVSAVRTEGIDGGVGDHPVSSWAIQITAPISPGSSGSPIMTRDGRVIAVAVGKLTGGDNLNFGVPIEIVSAQLADLGPDAVAHPFASGPSGTWWNLVISAGVFGLIAVGFVVSTWMGRRRRR